VEKVAKEVTEDFRLLSRTVRAATPETAAERAKLTQVRLGLMSVAATIESHDRRQKTTIRLLLLLSGLISGILVLIISVR